jgi:hypothetical protein
LIPASVAVFSNVPGFDQKANVMIDEDPGFLVAQMYHYMERISQTAYDLLFQDPDLHPIIHAMQLVKHEAKVLDREWRALKRRIREYGPETELMTQEREQLSFQMKKMGKKSAVARRFLRWCKQLPVIGFNSGKFLNFVGFHKLRNIYIFIF